MVQFDQVENNTLSTCKDFKKCTHLEHRVFRSLGVVGSLPWTRDEDTNVMKSCSVDEARSWTVDTPKR